MVCRGSPSILSCESRFGCLRECMFDLVTLPALARMSVGHKRYGRLGLSGGLCVPPDVRCALGPAMRWWVYFANTEL
jgi:hypothetical protein